MVGASDDRVYVTHNVSFSYVDSSGPFPCAGITGSTAFGGYYNGVQCATYPYTSIGVAYPYVLESKPRVKNSDSYERYLHAYWS